MIYLSFVGTILMAATLIPSFSQDNAAWRALRVALLIWNAVALGYQL